MRSAMVKKVLFILVFCGIVICQSNPSQDLAFEIQVEKPVYLLDEPIFVQMKETNLSNHDLYTSTLNIEARVFFSIKLVSSTGYVGTSGTGAGEVLPMNPLSGALLKPGESRYFVFQLNYYFGERDERDVAFHTRYLPVGDYELHITHFSNANYVHEQFEQRRTNAEEINIDRRPIVANPVRFKVIQTIGQQETERLDFLHTMQNSMLSRYKDKDNVQSYSYLENFYNKYSNSPYISTIIRHSFMINIAKKHITPFITISGEFDRSKNNFSSFLLRRRAKYLFPDLKSDPRYITPKKIAYEREAQTYQGTILGKYFSTEARDKQYELDALHANGKKEGRSSR